MGKIDGATNTNEPIVNGKQINASYVIWDEGKTMNCQDCVRECEMRSWAFAITNCGGFQPKEDKGETMKIRLDKNDNPIDFDEFTKLPYTADVRRIMNALWILGFKWLVADSDGEIYAYKRKPIKHDIGWMDSDMQYCISDFAADLEFMDSLVSWSDTEPLELWHEVDV